MVFFLVYFKKIKKTAHYTEHHEKEVPWFKVVDIICKSSKSARRKQGMIEIEDSRYYVLCRLDQDALHVVNAKRKR